MAKVAAKFLSWWFSVSAYFTPYCHPANSGFIGIITGS
jgi:hypothetical protein